MFKMYVLYLTIFLPHKRDMSEQLRVRTWEHTAVMSAVGKMEPTLKMCVFAT